MGYLLDMPKSNWTVNHFQVRYVFFPVMYDYCTIIDDKSLK
jgi:hypothetical protein